MDINKESLPSLIALQTESLLIVFVDTLRLFRGFDDWV